MIVDVHAHVIVQELRPHVSPPPSAVGEFVDPAGILAAAERAGHRPRRAVALGAAPVRRPRRSAGSRTTRWPSWCCRTRGSARFGAVPLHDPALAVRELREVMEAKVLSGVEVPASVGGVYLGDDALRAVLGGGRGDRRGRLRPPDDARLRRPGVRRLLPVEHGRQPVRDHDHRGAHGHGRACSSAIPGLRVILAHGGGALPALRGRLRHAALVPAARPRAAARGSRGVDRAAVLRHRDARPGGAALARRLRRRRPRAARHRPSVRHGRPAPGGDGARGRPGAPPSAAVLGGTALRLLEREGRAHVTADIVVAGAGHNSLITAAYLAASGREVLVLDSRGDPRRRRRDRGAARAGLPDRLVLDRPHADPDQPAADARTSSGLQGALRARVPGPRPVRARRVPRRRAAHRVDGPRAHGRGDLALLEGRRRGLPAAAGRLRRGQAHLRGRHLQPGRLRAVGRAAAARAPAGQRVAAAAGAERVGRDPARVRVAARAGASCSGRRTRRSCRSSRPARGRWRTRSCSAASAAAGRSRAAARAG